MWNQFYFCASLIQEPCERLLIALCDCNNCFLCLFVYWLFFLPYLQPECFLKNSSFQVVMLHAPNYCLFLVVFWEMWLFFKHATTKFCFALDFHEMFCKDAGFGKSSTTSDSRTPMCSSEAGYQLSIFCWSWQRMARPTIRCIVLQLSSLVLTDKHLNVSQICCLGVKYTGGGVNHRSWQKFFLIFWICFIVCL